jgi:hypothetical protein
VQNCNTDARGDAAAGPGVERAAWEGGEAAAPPPALMSPTELAAYEEKKLKLRKAMGENLSDGVEGEAPDSRQRR